MKNQYARIRTDLSRVLKAGGLPTLDQRINIIATRLSVVLISLRDPAVAPKIFERLNYGAEPITVADLVRNEVFARSGDDPMTAHHLFSTRWEPFVSRFKDKNGDLDRFLFPYGLISNPNTKKADLFPALRKIWEEFADPGKIIDDLEQYQDAYLALADGKQYAAVSSPAVRARIDRIYRAGRPSSIYPFVLQLLLGFEKETISEATACAALDAIESFLFRRSVAGIEPTGLHAVFKGLWQELTTGFEGPLDEALSVERFRHAVCSKATIAWPSDDEFQAAIISGELYRRKIVNYAIREFEVSLKGESPSDGHQVEHVAPQTPTAAWELAIPKDYAKVVHTWGNLLPLTPSMNPSTGQGAFEAKKKAYANSIFASAREVAQVGTWDAQAIRARSGRIANWALERWPY